LDTTWGIFSYAELFLSTNWNKHQLQNTKKLDVSEKGLNTLCENKQLEVAHEHQTKQLKGYSTMACTARFLNMTILNTSPEGSQIVCITS